MNHTGAGISGCRILVVDDEAAIRGMCQDLLEGEGYQVETATNGREAVERLSRQAADVVLMDIMMPELDGLSACRMLQAHSELRRVPVVIMSAATNIRQRTTEITGLAADILPKPFDLDHLLDVVARQCHVDGGPPSA